MTKMPAKLRERIQEAAERWANDSFRPDAQGDEQSYFKDGVEFGFNRGAEACWQDLAECVEALRFYADELNWDAPNELPNPSCWDDGAIETGQRAREALKKLRVK